MLKIRDKPMKKLKKEIDKVYQSILTDTLCIKKNDIKNIMLFTDTFTDRNVSEVIKMLTDNNTYIVQFHDEFFYYNTKGYFKNSVDDASINVIKEDEFNFTYKKMICNEMKEMLL